jgi:hypothetical protein
MLCIIKLKGLRDGLSKLLLMSTLQQNWRKGENSFHLEARRVQGRGRGGGRGEMPPTMYPHMKINEEKISFNC